MKIICRHGWPSTLAEAVRLQADLAGELTSRPEPDELTLVAAADAAYLTDRGEMAAAAVIIDRRSGEVVDRAQAVRPVSFPYISGYLTFREGFATIIPDRRFRGVPVDGCAVPAVLRRTSRECGIRLFSATRRCDAPAAAAKRQTARATDTGRSFAIGSRPVVRSCVAAPSIPQGRNRPGRRNRRARPAPPCRR